MRLILVLVAALTLAGCTQHSDKSRTEAGKSGPAVARMEGDRQVVTVVVNDAGYTPATIQLKAGVPARIVFRQETGSECLSHVKIDDLGVPATKLPLNEETAIEFTPDQSGRFTFTCGMEMAKGTIIVTS